MKSPSYYVSITGLTLRGVWHYPTFWYHAIPSFNQAQAAPGNIRTEARSVDGVQHTLTVWEDRKSMLRFLHTGPHLQAMKAFDSIATGKTYGYETDVIPSWTEALKLWEEKGKMYEGRRKKVNATATESDTKTKTCMTTSS